MTICLRTILLSLALFTNIAAAADTNNPFGQETGNQFSLSGQIEFVPVEQAYHSTLELKSSSWSLTGLFAMATTYTATASALDLWITLSVFNSRFLNPGWLSGTSFLNRSWRSITTPLRYGFLLFRVGIAPQPVE